ncbi:DNA polymerase III subunit tau [Maioricimonas rarisocia]|uniref:DNA polymerase III subunit tau n=2 Tax=Maioricimonas rarisocia TaxID=2528026 RepID=A0A517ZEZ2_9PLAN|nr:DNA polymerase III subunit tau [Maioricimonas rarisocia]
MAMFRRALQRGRTAHAYLLVGPDGIGKRQFAWVVAQCLFCRETDDAELSACGECPACKQVAAGSHPDLLTVGCPEGKKELPIEVMVGSRERRGREGLCHDLSLRPMSASRRIAIIDDADKMNEASANALLKTLEEPPEGSILILLTPSKDAILSTIQSRCQPIQFSPLTAEQVTTLLVEQDSDIDQAAALEAATLSEGSLTTARQLLEPGLRKLRESLYSGLAVKEFNSLRTMKSVSEALDELGGDPATQRQNARWLVKFAVEFYRGVLVASLEDRVSLHPQMLAFARMLPADQPEYTDRLMAMMERCFDAERHLDQSMSIELSLEGLFDDLSRLWRGAIVV